MKKLLVVFGLLLLVSALPAFAQYPATGPGWYYVDYYSNNVPGSAPDQVFRVINTGQGGTPLTVPAGNICANIYVFDNNQEMIECCACLLTPNELASASVQTQLTGGAGHVPLTGISPQAGVLKVVLTQPNAASGGGCDPTNSGKGLGTADTTLGAAYMSHVQNSSTNPLAATYSITETTVQAFPLSGLYVDAARTGDEGHFLPQACGFVKYLGSGRVGTCGCSAPGF